MQSEISEIKPMIEIVKKAENKGDESFTILIPTWNNLPYLRLCIKSLRQNSTFNHQIIVHVNEGTDGTLEWLETENVTVTYSRENIGVCWSLNGMRSFVETDYIVYMNDDMYACPGWDAVLKNEINLLPDNNFFLSSTLIQPRPFWCKAIISPADYGQTAELFNERKLLDEYAQLPHSDWSGSTWPLNIVHKELWDLVGGYSTEFSPGMYSDPDFSAKLWMAGVRYFKGLSMSRVYHFEARSTNRIVKNEGSRQFLSKWGITSSVFIRLFLRRGKKWSGILREPERDGKLNYQITRSRLKRWLESFKKSGMSRNIFE
jgi:glycosyltransferase involved in cell wall biosynthesis